MLKKAKKSISLLVRKTAWKCLFKSLLFVLGLFLIWRFSFSWWMVLVFFGVLALIYFREDESRRLIRSSFLILALESFLVLHFLAASLFEAYYFWIIAGLGLVFLFLIGLPSLFFKNRFIIYALLNTFIVFLNFLLFSFLNFQKISYFYALLFFMALFLLFKEAFGFVGIKWPKRAGLLSALSSFLLLQISWFLAFLPLGRVNTAAYLTILAILLREIVTAHFKGSLNYLLVFEQTAFCVILMVVIFAVSKWTI